MKTIGKKIKKIKFYPLFHLFFPSIFKNSDFTVRNYTEINKLVLELSHGPYKRRSQVDPYYINTDQLANPVVIDFSGGLGIHPNLQLFAFNRNERTVIYPL